MKEGLAVITAVMPTYGRKDVVFERGEGNYLYATDGRRYVDFTSGIAVNALGHCHPYLVKALTDVVVLGHTERRCTRLPIAETAPHHTQQRNNVADPRD